MQVSLRSLALCCGRCAVGAVLWYACPPRGAQGNGRRCLPRETRVRYKPRVRHGREAHCSRCGACIRSTYARMHGRGERAQSRENRDAPGSLHVKWHASGTRVGSTVGHWVGSVGSC